MTVNNTITRYAFKLLKEGQQEKQNSAVRRITKNENWGLSEDDHYDYKAVESGMLHGLECMVSDNQCDDREEQASHWYMVGDELSNRKNTTKLPSERFKRTHRW